MATDMTEEELAHELANLAGQGGTDVSYMDTEDSDNYVTATAYTNAAGREWRQIETAGMNSRYGWVANCGEWLDPGEDSADFGQDNT